MTQLNARGSWSISLHFTKIQQLERIDHRLACWQYIQIRVAYLPYAVLQLGFTSKVIRKAR